MPLQQPAILVVDDEPDILELLGFLLAREGYRVLHALNGRTALERLERCRVDLILTDLMMPGMDGAQLIKAIRSQEAHKAVPIMMLSALPEATVRTLVDQYQVFLRKPFKAEVLLALVRSLLPSYKVDLAMGNCAGSATTADGSAIPLEERRKH